MDHERAEHPSAPADHGSAVLAGPEKLPRNVIVLSWVSFFQDAASELLYPIFPLFVTGTLGAPASALGLIEGVAEGTASIGKAVSGRLADRYRRRPLVALGYGLSSLAKPVIGLAGVWPVALAGRFADRAGKGLRTSPRDAILAGDTPEEIRGRAFGFHRAADTAGAVVGPLLGLGLYELLSHRLRPLFFLAFIPAAISVGLVAFVRESGPAPADRRPEPAKDGAAADRLPRRYWRVVLPLAVFGLANFSDALLILRVREIGLGFVSVILVYTLYNAVYSVLSFPAGIISDRVPRQIVYASGLLVFALAYVGLGLARTTAWVWVLLPLYGAYTALTDGVGKAWIADLLPARLMGTGLGVYQGITGGCALVASIWAGLAWGGNGRLPLIVSGATVGVLAVGLLLAGVLRPPPRGLPASRSPTSC